MDDNLFLLHLELSEIQAEIDSCEDEFYRILNQEEALLDEIYLQELTSGIY